MGVVVLLLSLGLFVPVPMSNIPPSLTILLIAFAYLEEDGMLLCLALFAAFVLLTFGAAVAWQALGSAGWAPSLPRSGDCAARKLTTGVSPGPRR